MAGELSRDVNFGTIAASGTTNPLKTPVLDMSGYEGVLFFAGATVTSTAQHLKMRMSTASASGGMSDATGRIEHATMSIYLDVRRPIKQFVQGLFTASGASSPARSISWVQYGARTLPVTQETTMGGLRVYSPGSGTATG